MDAIKIPADFSHKRTDNGVCACGWAPKSTNYGQRSMAINRHVTKELSKIGIDR